MFNPLMGSGSILLKLNLTPLFPLEPNMSSFDVVSEVNHHKLSNAVDQANREVSTRFDFKGSGSNFKLKLNQITMNTEPKIP
jgi:uncharacterized protein YajQ (UPF0234 family)